MPFRSVFDQWFPLWCAIAAGFFVVIVGILVVGLLRNRAGRRAKPLFHASANNKIEGSIVVFLAAVAGFLVWGSLTSDAQVGQGTGRPAAVAEAAAAPDPIPISVEAFRWCWSFGQPGVPVRSTGTCADPASWPTVVVPAGQPVRFDLTSRDVVHAFWLPDFRVKRDVFPDHVNTLEMTFPEEGRWRGRCSEFCGTHHMDMDFYVRVVSPQEYQQFVASGGAGA